MKIGEENENKSNTDMENNKFWFKYAHLPVELFANKRLSKIDCLVFAMINLKDSPEKHCYASNNFFASLLSVTEKTISNSIKRLKLEEYIENVSFNGRQRVIKIKEGWQKKHELFLLKIVHNQETFKEPSMQHGRNLPAIIKDNNNQENSIVLLETKEIVSNKTIKAFSRSSNAKTLTTSSQEKIRENKGRLLHRRNISKSLSAPGSLPSSMNLSPINRKEISTDLKNHSPLPTVPTAPARVQDIFDYWESLDLHFTNKEKAPKTYKNDINMVKALLKEYTPDEIKMVIARFSIAALDNNCLPSEIKKKEYQKMPISIFIERKYKDKKDESLKSYSLFKFYSENEPKSITPALKIPDDVTCSMIANQLKKLYRREVLGGLSLPDNVNINNQFILASTKLIEFWGNNRPRIIGSYTPAEMAICLFNAVKLAVRENLYKISPGWLCSNTMFSDRLPKYLNKEGIIDDCRDDGYYRWNTCKQRGESDDEEDRSGDIVDYLTREEEENEEEEEKNREGRVRMLQHRQEIEEKKEQKWKAKRMHDEDVTFDIPGDVTFDL